MTTTASPSSMRYSLYIASSFWRTSSAFASFENSMTSRSVIDPIPVHLTRRRQTDANAGRGADGHDGQKYPTARRLLPTDAPRATTPNATNATTLQFICILSIPHLNSASSICIAHVSGLLDEPGIPWPSLVSQYSRTIAGHADPHWIGKGSCTNPARAPCKNGYGHLDQVR